MLEAAGIYLLVATIVGVDVTLFDGGHTYKEQYGRMGKHTVKTDTIRRNGETGAHATARIVTKALFWPVVVCVYVLKPLALYIYNWLTEKHEPSHPE